MLAFSTDDLATRFRSDVDDVVTDEAGSDFGCLWKDSDVYSYMTEACAMVASRTSSLYRTLQLPFSAGMRLLPLPRFVREIRSARLAGCNRPVVQRNANDMALGGRDDYGLKLSDNSEMFEGSGRPTSFVRDYDTGQLRLVPAPVEGDTLEIQCTVSISMPLCSGMPMPLTDLEDQVLVLHYMKMRAYRKHDAETEDLVRAREYERLYETGVTARASDLRNNRRAPGQVRMNW